MNNAINETESADSQGAGVPLALRTVCKFACYAITHYATPAQTVKLQAQYDANIPEDRRFSQFTPSGTMELQVDNPAIAGFFKPGKQYLITISEAE